MIGELPLSAGRKRILGLVYREWRTEHSEEIRFGCCGRVVGNMGSEMLSVVKTRVLGLSCWVDFS